MKLTVKQFESEVRYMDKHINGRQLKASVVLLAATQEGTQIDRLVAFTHYSKRTVTEFVARLRDNGIFTSDGRVAGAAEWFDEESGGVAFWCDVCVALGFFKRSEEPRPVDAVARTPDLVTG